MKQLLKKIFRIFGLEITRYRPQIKERELATLSPPGGSKGNVLISYILEPFFLKPGEPLPHSHTNYWESLQIAKTFLELGYSVDVIDYRNKTFIPKKDYSFFIDVRHNLERLAPLLNKDCVKIMHIDLCHMLFNNAAEANRLLALQQRKGVTLKPRRFEMPNLGIEYADYVTVLGNEFTIDTFRYANKPIYRIPISNPLLYPWPEAKDFETSRRNYIWFGSGGLVRKGLDLVLDAFSEMPDYHLFVCGPIKQEEDFEKAYHKELYETPNIYAIGWVDVSSIEFIEIANRCVGVVFPSAAEGGGGSVITCMHTGLIPIVSYESSVDVDEMFGAILKDCSIDTIQNTVQKISGFPAEKLKQMAHKAWEFARANHTQERFAEEFKKIILKILRE